MIYYGDQLVNRVYFNGVIVAGEAPVVLSTWLIEDGIILDSPPAPSPPIVSDGIITGYIGAFTLGATEYTGTVGQTSVDTLTATEAVTFSKSGLDDALFTLSGADLSFAAPALSGVFDLDVTGTNDQTSITTPIEVLVPEAAVDAFDSNDIVFYLVAGQSNALGVGSSAATYVGPDYPAGVEFVTDDAGTTIPADFAVFSNWLSYDLQFSLDFVRIHPGAGLAISLVAEGGTGFINNRWNPGDDLYNAAVSRVNGAMTALAADNPSKNVIFGGILWHQGEADSSNPGFQTALDTMIGQIRTDITAAGPTTPFIAGQLSSFSPNYATNNAIIADLPNRIAHTAFVSSVDAGPPDNIHFNHQGRALLGRRYARAIGRARDNT